MLKGLICFFAYALVMIALAWLCIAGPADATPREGRPLRGHLTLCIVEAGRPLQCGRTETLALFDTHAECVNFLNTAFARYRDTVRLQRPLAVLRGEYSCRFEDGVFEA
jgi:hypothetical protein